MRPWNPNTKSTGPAPPADRSGRCALWLSRLSHRGRLWQGQYVAMILDGPEAFGLSLLTLGTCSCCEIECLSKAIQSRDGKTKNTSAIFYLWRTKQRCWRVKRLEYWFRSVHIFVRRLVINLAVCRCQPIYEGHRKFCRQLQTSRA